MIYGYCRISTPKQSIDRQIRNITQSYPQATIITEAYTGTSINRPQWEKLEAKLKQGDTVVFDSVSRMSRNAEDGYQVYQSLFNRQINLVFIREPMINTDTYRNAITNAVPMTGTAVDCILQGVNQYLLVLAKDQIRLAFEQAEKEVQDLHQRTREGIVTARLNGKQIGQREGIHLTTRKSIGAKQIIKTHSRDFGGTLSDDECIKLAQISRNTFYKYKRELKQEQ